jgi:hypothetical protein
MTTRGLRPDIQQRLQHLTGADPEAVATFVSRNEARIAEIARIVHEDEVENAEFYRQLGDR